MDTSTVKTNYLAAKYTVDNLKKDKNKILHGSCLNGYGVSLYGKDYQTKTYYDTQDAFFYQVGITININKIKNIRTELVVRYNGVSDRIEFLSDIPDTFVLNIKPNSSIREHIDFITSAIYELIPNGISTDVKKMLQTIKPIMVVEKKRERHRAINANGFKTIISFTQAVYHNNLSRVRQKTELVELESANHLKSKFMEFNKLLTFEFTNLIKVPAGDLEVAFTLCVK